MIFTFFVFHRLIEWQLGGGAFVIFFVCFVFLIDINELESFPVYPSVAVDLNAVESSLGRDKETDVVLLLARIIY